MKRKSSAALAAALAAREEIANSIRRIESARFEHRAGSGDGHERIEEINSSLISEAFFVQPLTDFAVGFRDEALDAELEFFAPEVPVTNRFSYSVFDNAEEFLSDGDDDARPIKSDFKDVSYTSTKVEAAVKNHGLQITLDLDQLGGRSDWEEYYVQKLMRRIKRNSLRRAIALLSAGATNTAKTWDTTAGKDPDQDIETELVTAANISGITPSRIGFGSTAWSRRRISHRAQNTSGGFASARLTPEELAADLNVEAVLRSKARYTSGAATKAEIVGNLVLMFNAEADQSSEDASNIKRFVANGNAEEGGGRYQVYSQRVSAKRHVIAVGHYELTKLTSTLGIRKFTVS